MNVIQHSVDRNKSKLNYFVLFNKPVEQGTRLFTFKILI